MNYVLNTEYGHPDAEDEKVTQRTQKGRKGIQSYFLIAFNFSENFVSIFVSIFGFLLRPLRNFCVLCVRKFSPSSPRAASMI
jgi:hypothetical protein